MIKITPCTTPSGKLADVEIVFPTFTEAQRANLTTVRELTYTQPEAIALQDAARAALAFEGLKLVGFAVFERRTGGGRNVTFPARQYSVNGERRSFALLRPTVDTTASDRMRDLILDAYAEFERAIDTEPIERHAGSGAANPDLLSATTERVS